LRKSISILLLASTSVYLSGCLFVAPMVMNQMAPMVANQMTATAVSEFTNTLSREEGIAKKNSNVRSGPGTKNKKVGRLPKGSRMTVLKTEGKWLKIEADTNKGFVEGWVYAPLVKVVTISTLFIFD